MNISGILVMSEPEHTGDTVERLKTLPGIDVHHVDNTTGRIVITQEAETIKDEVDGLKHIKTLPHIILAEMSAHYFEEDRELMDAIPADLDDEGLHPDSVPARLNS